MLLQKWHVLLEEHVDELARIMTLESGKPVKESLGEIAYGNSFVDWYAAEARRVYVSHYLLLCLKLFPISISNTESAIVAQHWLSSQS